LKFAEVVQIHEYGKSRDARKNLALLTVRFCPYTQIVDVAWTHGCAEVQDSQLVSLDYVSVTDSIGLA